MEPDGHADEPGAEPVEVLLVTGGNPLQDDAAAGMAARGFSVTRALNGASAIRSLRGCRFDLVLLDLVLPDVDGIALLSAIRAARPQLPVIALTATNAEDLRLLGFARGADDCVALPISVPELIARMLARLRSHRQGGTVVEAGPLSLDISRNRAAIGERVVPLSPREGSLLATFVQHAGEVLPREALLKLVWELEFDPRSNIVDVYVAALRRKLGAQVIETVRGRGYRLRASALASKVTLSA